MTTAANEPRDQETFELCEREDETQILAELSGRVSEKYVYEFPSAEGTVTGLTYVGTNWACREFAKHGEAIRIASKPEIQPDPLDPEYVIVSVVAQRFAVNPETGRETALDSAVGVKRQWTKLEKKGGQIIFNKFFIEHGVSKAQRNAKQALLPVDFVKKMVVQALGQKKGQKPAGQAAPSQTRPPAKPASAPAAPPAAGQQAAPAGAAPAASGTAAKPATPAQPQKPPTAPGKPAPAGAKSATDPVGAMRQKFWATIKKAANTNDDNVARVLLKELVGVDKVSELDEPVLKSLGNALVGVNLGNNELADGPSGRLIVDRGTGAVLYPIQPPPVAAQEEAPQVPEGDQMF